MGLRGERAQGFCSSSKSADEPAGSGGGGGGGRGDKVWYEGGGDGEGAGDMDEGLGREEDVVWLEVANFWACEAFACFEIDEQALDDADDPDSGDGSASGCAGMGSGWRGETYFVELPEVSVERAGELLVRRNGWMLGTTGR